MSKKIMKNWEKWLAGFVVVAILSAFIIFHTDVFNHNSIQVNSGGYPTVSVPIIMYHSILKNNGGSGSFIVTPNQLEKDLRYLSENGYKTVVMKDLIEYVYNGKVLPEKPVVITFDDGHYNNFYYADPLLKKYNMKAVLSVVGDYIDRADREGEENPNYSYIKSERLKELIADGIFEIQNHSYSLHSISNTRYGCGKNQGESLEKYKDIFISDAQKLQNKLYDLCGYSPTTFTYPFGKKAKESDALLKESGFKASLSCREAVNHLQIGEENCLFSLGRFLRMSGISSEQFFKKIRDRE